MNKNWIKELIFNQGFPGRTGYNFTPVVFEIGAADATDSIEFVQHFEFIDLYTFEPDPRNLKHLNNLKQRVNEQFINGERKVHVYEGVVGDIDGQVEFNLSDGDNSHPDYGVNFRAHSGSIKKPKLHLEMHPHILFNNSMVVNSTKLDTFCENNNINLIDFLWADVQGAEDLLIKGGIETFQKRARFFYTEYYNTEVYENQPSLSKIQELLGDNWIVVQDFGHDALFYNKKFI